LVWSWKQKRHLSFLWSVLYHTPILILKT
jgi:hypothetical protein